MKRDRNSFFESSNFNMSSYGANPMMPNMGVPMMNAASSNFYQSQNMPMPNYPTTQTTNTTSEIESRLAKLERSINRLDARLSKLEGTYFTKDTYDIDNNMYMV